MTTIPARPAPVVVSRPRRLAFAILAALLGVFTGVVMGGATALVATFTATGHEVIHQIHYLHWGVLMVGLTAAPLLWMAARPTVATIQQATIVVTSFVIAAVAAGMFDASLLLFPILIALLLALHPRRGALLERGDGLHTMLGALAAAVTLPTLWYSVGELQMHLAAPLADPHRGPPEAHYVTGAALALAIVGVAWLASLRTQGWRVPAWCAGLAMAVTGAVSVWLPGWVSSFGRPWGVAAVLWGLAFIDAAHRADRREVA